MAQVFISADWPSLREPFGLKPTPQIYTSTHGFGKVLFDILVLTLNRADAKIAVNGYPVAGSDIVCRSGYSGDAGNSIFPGDDCPMDEHSSPTLNYCCCQRCKKGHGRIDRIDNQYFSFSETRQICHVLDDPCSTGRHPSARRLPLQLPCLYPLLAGVLGFLHLCRRSILGNFLTFEQQTKVEG